MLPRLVRASEVPDQYPRISLRGMILKSAKLAHRVCWFVYHATECRESPNDEANGYRRYSSTKLMHYVALTPACGACPHDPSVGECPD